MVGAIPRYGLRVVPETGKIIEDCRRRGEFIQGPQIREFENAFAHRLGGGHAISASYGRMAFYYILRALQLPKDSEIVIPALTFWVVPEIARTAGCRVVFADIDPRTFTLDPKSLERVITPATRAVVPTHLYGVPCDMDAIRQIAKRHGLYIIEDCAHSLGTMYHGQAAGTLGDASFFSFQTIKPLNAYGGGMAYTRNSQLASQIESLAAAERWPTEERVRRKLLMGKVQRIFTRPGVFTVSGFPILWGASFFSARPDIYLWESIRSLNPLPEGYRERFSNVQAALGLAGLEHIDEWNLRCRRNAAVLSAALSGLHDVQVPYIPPDCETVYYQYCIYVSDRDEVVRQCIRHGIDAETLHVDVNTTLPLFGEHAGEAPNAEKAAEVVQLPVYASLTPRQVEAVGRRVRSVLMSWTRQSEESTRTVQM
jgi:dTDP-4-amino-4,6-dideoxygalactose transaminase